MKIGEYIKEYRERMGLSQRKFAAQCDLSNAFINMLEKDENPKTGKPIELSIGKYKKIANGTGVTVDQLFTILGPDAPVKINNPILDMVAPPHEFHPSLLAALEARTKPETPQEDAKLTVLWRSATLQAKRAAIAVLESMKEENLK